MSENKSNASSRVSKYTPSHGKDLHRLSQDKSELVRSTRTPLGAQSSSDEFPEISGADESPDDDDTSLDTSNGGDAREESDSDGSRIGGNAIVPKEISISKENDRGGKESRNALNPSPLSSEIREPHDRDNRKLRKKRRHQDVEAKARNDSLQKRVELRRAGMKAKDTGIELEVEQRWVEAKLVYPTEWRRFTVFIRQTYPAQADSTVDQIPFGRIQEFGQLIQHFKDRWYWTGAEESFEWKIVHYNGTLVNVGDIHFKENVDRYNEYLRRRRSLTTGEEFQEPTAPTIAPKSDDLENLVDKKVQERLNEMERQKAAKLEAEERARLEAEERARLEAEERARLEAEERARLEREESLKQAKEKAEQAQKQAEEAAHQANEAKRIAEFAAQQNSANRRSSPTDRRKVSAQRQSSLCGRNSEQNPRDDG